MNGYNHSPGSEKVSYMLSDLNDHHNMRTRFIENEDKDYVHITVWFDNLRNSLKTSIGYDGQIQSGHLKCVIDGRVTSRDEVDSILPEWADLRNYIDNGEDTTMKIFIHESLGGESMDPNEYVRRAKDLKTILIKREFIYTNFN